jgi:hypothetical protein
LNVPALLGRAFSMAEEGSGARVAVVSYGIWQRRFASSPDIVGKTLEIDQLRTK